MNNNEIISRTDAVNSFYQNVVNVLQANAHNEYTGCYFGSSVYYGTDGVYQSWVGSQQAIPTIDLDNTAIPEIKFYQNEIINSNTLYNVLLMIANSLTKIRNFVSYWYHNYSGAYAL